MYTYPRKLEDSAIFDVTTGFELTVLLLNSPFIGELFLQPVFGFLLPFFRCDVGPTINTRPRVILS